MTQTRNYRIAAMLRKMADVLEQQNANRFRISAYRRAAATVAEYATDVGLVLEREGLEGLIAIPGIGRGIATAIQEIIATGNWPQLARLSGTLDPDTLFQTVPGIGPALAHRIHDKLHIDTLEALEIAAHNGRLKLVEGIGNRRIAAIAPALAELLGRRPRRAAETPTAVPVEVLLKLDESYRLKAGAGKLPLIAPRRFNPSARPWLPIMHATRDDWHFTLMYSNTARAHKLGRNFDWVVIYYYDHDHREGQHTAVTETRGDLTGQRVVRGREDECRSYYVRHGCMPASVPADDRHHRA